MGNLAISNKYLDKCFNYLNHFNDDAKKILIYRLTQSLEINSGNEFDIYSIFGAWEDDKSARVIIDEIKSSRVEKLTNQNLG